MPALPLLSPIQLERLMFALEALRGAAETAPTKFMKMVGLLTPKDSRDRGNDGLGILAKNTGIVKTRQWSELSAKGPTNIPRMGEVLRMVAKGGTITPTTPGAATQTELLTLTPNMLADDLDSMTVWGGNPNVQTFRAAGVMLDELGITSDGSGTKGLETSVKGMGLFPTKVSAPTAPTLSIDSQLAPGSTQVWIDTTLAAGTTAVAGRVVKTSPKVQTGRTYAFDNVGPGNDLTITAYGIDADKRGLDLGLTLELFDTAQYDLWAAMTFLKLRLRYNGALIETASAVPYYEYLQFDVVAPFDVLSWGDVNKSRTIDLTLLDHYDATMATDWKVSVQRKVGS